MERTKEGEGKGEEDGGEREARLKEGQESSRGQ